MSVNNFIPQVWASTLLKEIDKVFVAVKLCNRDYEGDIKQKGDRVKINGIGDITVNDYVKNTTTISLQELQDISTLLEITQSKYFAFRIDDVDKAQSNIKLMQEAMRKSAMALADVADQFVYGKYADAGTTITNAAVTSANIISVISSARKALRENNVPNSAEVSLEISPAIEEKLVLAKIIKDTDNSKTIEQGYLGNFLGFKLYSSNNIVKNGNAYECIARTKDAISFAEQINDVETFRLTTEGFGDAVKGLHLYGAKTVQPKQLVRLTLTPAAETTI